MKRTTVLWLALSAIWIGVILLLSSRSGAESHGMSSSLTQFFASIVAPDFSSWAPGLQKDWLDSVEQLVRKLAHFFEFGLLGALVSQAVNGFLRRSARRKYVKKMRVGMFSFYPCLLIAAVDEAVQLASAGRTSSPADVILDCAGIVVGIALSLSRVRQTPAEKSRSRTRRRAG